MAIYNGGLNVKNVSVTSSGSGNAITSLSADGNVITATKGATFLTSLPDHSHNYIPNYGTSMTLGDGTSCTIPSTMATSSVFSWRKSGGTSRDANIMYSSEDGAFLANSGDCGYVFAVYDTDVTTDGNFADTSQPLFKVNQGTSGYCEARYGFTAPAVYGAVWNDLADSISVDQDCELEHGYCYCFDGEKYNKSSKYMDDGIIGIHSDTFGFRMGYEKDKKKLDVAVSGFVLAYVDKEYPSGTPLTCTENGYLTEIKKQDKIEYPEKIVATYWKNEPSDEWGTEERKVKVNGRKWVKIK